MRTNEPNGSPPAPHLLVLAGGSGTRFWPKSTSRRPKQLLSFDPSDPSSLLKRTLARFSEWIPSSHQWILTTEALERAVRAEVGEGPRILAEPEARNTAPCLYWAAKEIANLDADAVLLVMSADHWIPDEVSFLRSVKEGAEWARTHDDLVTFGVKPTRPETGYGYVRTGASLGEGADGLRVEAFVEKPDLEKAKSFLSSGKYLWNGGMFAWRAETILRSFDTLLPEYGKAWESAGGEVKRAFPKMAATSIDFGILEKSRNVVTFPLDCGWDDLGSWSAMEALGAGMGAGIEAGTQLAGEVVALESRGNIIDVPGKVVALLGVEDLVIVESGEVLMILPKSRAQDVKNLSEVVKRKRPELG